CTTFLQYTQIHQENSLQLLLTLGAYFFLCRWANSDSRRDLLASALLAGFCLLVRLTPALAVLRLAVPPARLAFPQRRGGPRLPAAPPGLPAPGPCPAPLRLWAGGPGLPLRPVRVVHRDLRPPVGGVQAPVRPGLSGGLPVQRAVLGRLLGEPGLAGKI